MAHWLRGYVFDPRYIPFEVIANVFHTMSHVDLIILIAFGHRELSGPAEYVLKRRKGLTLRLLRLYLEENTIHICMISIDQGVTSPCNEKGSVFRHLYRYPTDHLAKLLAAVKRYFNCSCSHISVHTSLLDWSLSRFPLEDKLGSLANYSRTIVIDNLAEKTPEQLLLHSWVRCTVDCCLQFSQYLQHGVWVSGDFDAAWIKWHAHKNDPQGRVLTQCVDEFMTVRRDEKIVVDKGMRWNLNSFSDVLTDHANSGDAGVRRVIEMICLNNEDERVDHPDGRTAEEWIETLSNWRDFHVFFFGEPARAVTWKRVFSGPYDIIKLTFH